jgi:hypothetical protein
METKANEPAYPNIQVPSLKGLTKREYFAAMALQGLLGNNNNYVYSVISAVEFADDLIEELSKTKTNEKK